MVHEFADAHAPLAGFAGGPPRRPPAEGGQSLRSRPLPAALAGGEGLGSRHSGEGSARGDVEGVDADGADGRVAAVAVGVGDADVDGPGGGRRDGGAAYRLGGVDGDDRRPPGPSTSASPTPTATAATRPSAPSASTPSTSPRADPSPSGVSEGLLPPRAQRGVPPLAGRGVGEDLSALGRRPSGGTAGEAGEGGVSEDFVPPRPEAVWGDRRRSRRGGRERRSVPPRPEAVWGDRRRSRRGGREPKANS